MKQFGIIIGCLLILSTVIFYSITDPVDKKPYLETEYYNSTMTRLDSLKKLVSVSNDSLKAGFSRTSITPSINNQVENSDEGKFNQVPLAGFGKRKGKPAEGVHDSLFVKAVALQSGSKTVIFITADILIMPPHIIDSVSEILTKKGITRDRLFFSATHTHSSVGAWGSGFIAKEFSGAPNKNIEKWLVKQISNAALESVSDLSPATLGAGQFSAAVFTQNRLIGETGTKNDDFNYIRIEQTGKRKAIIGSFSAHSTTLGDKNMQFSADYPGYWQRKMEKSFDIALFFAGSVGSQSPSSKGENFEKSRYLGESLADSLNNVILDNALTHTPEIEFISLKTDLPGYHIRLLENRPFETWVSKKLMPLPNQVYFQAIRLGNVIWITTPCDFSGEFALQIKNTLDSKGFGSFVTSFNGSYIGYVIPGKYFYLDEYESKIMGWFGPGMGDYSNDIIRHLYDSLIN